MPLQVNCPVCSADGTESANTLLQQSAAPPPAEAAMPPPAPTAARLRVQSTEAPAPATPPVTPAPLPAFRPAPAKAKSGGKWKTALTMSLACLVLLGVGWKWYRRINRLVHSAIALGEASMSGTSGLENRNLDIDDGVALFVQHSNHLEVAEACGVFWTNKLGRGLSLTATNGDVEWTEKEFAVAAAHNGYVRIRGEIQWPKKEFDGLSQFLSQSLNTTVLEYAENDFSGAFVFGVYENGERRMFARKTVTINTRKNDVDETVTIEGKPYALAHGFKPDGQEGWDDFDGEVITKRLGVKMWDQKEGVPMDFVVLKELRGLSGTNQNAGTNVLRPRAVRTATQ